jgi:hypothetical protein
MTMIHGSAGKRAKFTYRLKKITLGSIWPLVRSGGRPSEFSPMCHTFVSFIGTTKKQHEVPQWRCYIHSRAKVWKYAVISAYFLWHTEYYRGHGKHAHLGGRHVFFQTTCFQI